MQCNLFESTEVLSNLIPLETLPNLTNDFARGSMGMVLVGGGLLAILWCYETFCYETFCYKI